MKEQCFCGSQVYTKVFEGVFKRAIVGDYPYSLYKCSQCGLIRTYPVQDPNLYINGDKVLGQHDDKGKYIAHEKPWMAPLAQKMKDMLSEFPHLANKPVLDLGCNAGEMVEKMNEIGIDAKGYDIDRAALEYGQARGLPISYRDVVKDGVEAGQYALITMIHTLEHIPPAAAFVQNAARGLVPGGLMHIQVPNFAGWIAKAMGNNWEFRVPTQHTWQFEPKTLQVNVEYNTGLRLVRLSCSTTLESNSRGIKGLVKRTIIAAGNAANQSDEISATFEKQTQ